MQSRKNTHQKSFVCLALLLTFVIPVTAAEHQWVKFYESAAGGFSQYISQSSIKNEGDETIAVILTDYATPRNLKGGSSLSRLEQFRFKCGIQAFKQDSSQKYWSEPMGRGNVVFEQPITDNRMRRMSPDNGHITAALNAACKDAPPPTEQEIKVRQKTKELQDSLDKQKNIDNAFNAASAFTVVGRGPLSKEDTVNLCTPTFRDIMISSIYFLKRPTIAGLEFFPQVDSEAVYGSFGPKTKLTPIKVKVLGLANGQLTEFEAKRYLMKNSFSEWECKP